MACWNWLQPLWTPLPPTPALQGLTSMERHKGGVRRMRFGQDRTLHVTVSIYVEGHSWRYGCMVDKHGRYGQNMWCVCHFHPRYQYISLTAWMWVRFSELKAVSRYQLSSDHNSIEVYPIYRVQICTCSYITHSTACTPSHEIQYISAVAFIPQHN